MFPIRTVAGVPLLALLLVAAAPLPAQADQRIRCESPDYRYRSCPIRERGEVRLVRQISKTRCVQGRNWGYDRRAVWVDEGCAAEFVVEDRGDHRPGWGGNDQRPGWGGNDQRPGWGGNDHRPGGDRWADALAALGATSADAPRRGDRAPGWMVGRFRGVARGETVELTIGADGRASARLSGVTVQGAVDGRRLWLGNAQLTVSPAADGFDTVQVGDPRNRVAYRRR